MKHFFLLSILFFTRTLFSLDFPIIQRPEDLAQLFPKTAEEMILKQEKVSKEVEEQLDVLRHLSLENASFANLILPFSNVQAYLYMNVAQSENTMGIEPRDDVRKQGQNSYVYYQNQSSHLFSNEGQIYQTIKSVYERDGSSFTPDQKYLTEYLLREFEFCGHSLSSEKREEIKAIKEEIAQLEQAFRSNIQEDQSILLVKPDALRGLNSQILSRFDQNETGEYTLRCDYLLTSL